MTSRRTSAICAAIGLALTLPSSAQAKRCQSVRVTSPTGTTGIAAVKVSRANVTCSTARRLVRLLVAGRDLPGSWDGEARDYGYGMTRARDGAFIEGSIK